MELFEPQLKLYAREGKPYRLLSVTLTPNSCYRAGPARLGAPEGFALVPEAQAVTLDLMYEGDICLFCITPVRHKIDVQLGQGKTRVVVFAMLDGKVVGSSSIPVGAAVERPADDQRFEDASTAFA